MKFNTLLFLTLALFTFSLQSCGSSKSKKANYNVQKTASKEKVKKGRYKSKVIACYYADKYNGRKTASGEKFSNNKLTAAHKKLPFGTIVKVTNIVNGKSVEVEINDRGPYTKGREIDLTKKAFMEITENKNNGTIKVNIDVVK